MGSSRLWYSRRLQPIGNLTAGGSRPREGKDSDDTHAQTARYQAARRTRHSPCGDRAEARDRPWHGRQVRGDGGLLTQTAPAPPGFLDAGRIQAVDRRVVGGGSAHAAQAAAYRQTRV